MDKVVEVIKRGACHKEFFDSIAKSPLNIMGELMKRAKKYVKLDDSYKVKREHDPR